MRTQSRSTSLVLTLLVVMMSVNFVWADDDPRYEVTIQSLTYDQIISPPLVALHNENAAVFRAGSAASEELAILAEDGNPEPLAALLGTLADVADVGIAGGGVLPGTSTTVYVEGPGSAKQISVVGMLISTNDAFIGLAGQATPRGSQTLTVNVNAYDAGSEANTEDCAHIPGPPCGNGGVRVTDGAEGFVFIHSGIRGDEDIDLTKDWRNPAARVTIKRVN